MHVYFQGYALIEYENFEEAQAAIKTMNGSKMLEQTINVDWAFCNGPYKRRGNRRRLVCLFVCWLMLIVFLLSYEISAGVLDDVLISCGHLFDNLV